MNATETHTETTTTAKPTWRDLTQAIVARNAAGELLVILTSKTEKSITKTKAQATSAGLEVLGDAPLVAKNELDIPKPAPKPAPEKAEPEQNSQEPQGQAEHSDPPDSYGTPGSDTREREAAADPRPDLPGKPPGAVPAPRAPRRSRKATGAKK